MLQVAGSTEAIEVVRLIASGTDIRNVKYRQELKLLQDTTPILASLLLKLLFSEAIPDDVCTLISHLCDLVLAPFQPRSQTFPSPPADSELTYFPNLPMVRGVPIYSADQSLYRQKQEDQDACRKYSSNHPTLTPGIFIMHGICCGFEVMKTHESPKHPFEIFLTCFESPPKMIIYDNSCKLHQNILNRELKILYFSLTASIGMDTLGVLAAIPSINTLRTTFQVSTRKSMSKEMQDSKELRDRSRI